MVTVSWARPLPLAIQGGILLIQIVGKLWKASASCENVERLLSHTDGFQSLVIVATDNGIICYSDEMSPSGKSSGWLTLACVPFVVRVACCIGYKSPEWDSQIFWMIRPIQHLRDGIWCYLKPSGWHRRIWTLSRPDDLVPVGILSGWFMSEAVCHPVDVRC